MKKYIQFIIIDIFTKKERFISMYYPSSIINDNIKCIKEINYKKYKNKSKSKKRSKYIKILLIPTIHISKASSIFIEQQFKIYNPTSIAVEICEERYHKINIFKKINLNSKIFQFKVNLIYLILKDLEKRFSSYSNEIFGIDLIKTLYLSRKYMCNLYLIDRNISDTIFEYSKSISILELFYLIIFYIKIYFDNSEFKKIINFKIEKYKYEVKDEIIDEFIKNLKKRFPSYYKIIIKDRNTILLSNIIKLITLISENEILFVIIGYGHYKYILKHLKDIL